MSPNCDSSNSCIKESRVIAMVEDICKMTRFVTETFLQQTWDCTNPPMHVLGLLHNVSFHDDNCVKN